MSMSLTLTQIHQIDPALFPAKIELVETNKTVLEFMHCSLAVRDIKEFLINYIDKTVKNPSSFCFYEVVPGKNIDYEVRINTFQHFVGSQSIPTIRIRRENVPFDGITELSAPKKKLRNLYLILNSGFQWFRPILGDGNCYFRAVIFGVLEQVVISNRQKVYFPFLRRLLQGFNINIPPELKKCLDSAEGSPYLSH